MQNLRQVLINDADYEHQLEKDEDMNQTPYDPYQCPPDLQEAEDHSKSRRVGQIKQGTRTCKCCRFVIDKKQLGNPSNYSLLVQNLPRHLSKKEIDEFLKISFFGDPLTDQIYRINMCYDYQEYLDSFNQKIKNIYATNICKLKLRDQYLEEPYAQETQDKLESLEQEQQVIDQKLMNFEHECLQERSKKFSGTVIVSFLTIQAKETILNKYKFTLKKTILNFFKKVYLRYHKNSIIINEAPGPRDVIWANLKYKLNQSISNLIKMFSMFVFLLVVSYYVQIQVLYKTLIYHELYNDGEQIVDKNYRLVQLAMAIAFLVLIINWVLRYIVGYPQKDCPYSQEEVNVSFEGPKLEFQEWVCSLIRIMVQTVWFGGIAPIQILISLLCILIGYWIDKYYLLRIFTVPISQTDHVFSFVFNLLKLIPILYYFGSIQFEQAISQEQNTLTFFKNYPEYLYCFLTSVVFTFLMYL
ncbi:hypothetical protein PPERSA_05067 [Pseudocohnilembus persalinus]|uniref:CSC1/OSCA1-like cytosolic domain-containing protein n=1 Tax=Pseudocohnilembus persalinus TaxID=266149 RepID=A0A0V0QW85_PSEPJ|nr:hypothetical protein PPERSA_05067 [Pseudocohnilembus persalinus]|eukprot:KRX06454.1 hypothetical protein PPERSA_05067 [Pseudocohnilembus persalinus]